MDWTLVEAKSAGLGYENENEHETEMSDER